MAGLDPAIHRDIAQVSTMDGAHTLSLAPEFCGNLHYYVRAYPYHKRLAHRFELGLMIWA